MPIPDDSFDLSVSVHPGARVVGVRGAIDFATGPRLATTLSEAIRSGDGDLIVDLSAVEFVDSTGLAVLLNARRRGVRAGCGLRVVAPSGTVRGLFSVRRLDDDLETFGSVDEALAA